MNEKTELEQAPPNSLPDWHECQRILDNHDFRQRAAMGLEGSVLDTPPTTPEPTELHRFIYEYDDADPYRSAWFMHRLELVLNEARATSPSSKSTKEADNRAVMQQARDALQKTMAAWGGTCAWHADVKSAIAAIDAALASSSIKEDGERAEYTGELWQDAICERFAAAGFKYDGFGSWQADLTTTEMLALAAALSSPPSPLGDTPDQQEKKQ